MEAKTDFYGEFDAGKFLHYQWDESLGIVKTNTSGSSGWARMLRSCESYIPVDKTRRVHRCAHNPCRARWDAIKYGPVGPPIHVQTVDAGEASFGPESAELPTGTAPAPAPLDPQLRVGTEQQRSCGDDAAAAQHCVHSRVFDLANEIQRVRAYVGYVFFVLVGLLKKAPAMHVGGP